jgi:hypothetical protein
MSRKFSKLFSFYRSDAAESCRIIFVLVNTFRAGCGRIRIQANGYFQRCLHRGLRSRDAVEDPRCSGSQHWSAPPGLPRMVGSLPLIAWRRQDDQRLSHPAMHIIDSHFHWYPPPIFERLCQAPAIR